MNKSTDEINERKRIYENLREHILKSQLSNSENFDKAILSLSSAFLAASLTFTNNVVPLNKAGYLWLLFLSWSSFLLAVISTIVSYLISQKAFNVLLEHSAKYYLELKDEYRDRSRNKWANWNDRLSIASAVFFVAGIFFIAFFLYLNINRGE